jgi:transcriptional regulator with XRE-family HTH domain
VATEWVESDGARFYDWWVGNHQRAETSFGSMVKLLRVAKRMALKKLAEECGIDPGNLSRIEHGERNPTKLETVLRLMHALGIAMGSCESAVFMIAAVSSRSSELSLMIDENARWDNPKRYGLVQQKTQLARAGEEAMDPAAPSMTLSQAVLELGKISASQGVRKLRVETSNGSTIDLIIGGSVDSRVA